ncbi:hypothetical protein ACFX2F_002771 [Malus domestica]
MLYSKHQENHCEKSFIDAGKADEPLLPSRDDKKSCTNICFSKRSFDFTAERSEKRLLKSCTNFLRPWTDMS